MRYKTQIGISIIVLLLMSQTYAMSWGHIGHYAIGREMRLLSAECGNMNLPDIWISYGSLWTLYGITDQFCWSHAVQRTGRSSWGVPNVPYYPDDNREPGKIMYEIVTTKVDWPSTKIFNAKFTARGWGQDVYRMG